LKVHTDIARLIMITIPIKDSWAPMIETAFTKSKTTETEPEPTLHWQVFVSFMQDIGFEAKTTYFDCVFEQLFAKRVFLGKGQGNNVGPWKPETMKFSVRKPPQSSIDGVMLRVLLSQLGKKFEENGIRVMLLRETNDKSEEYKTIRRMSYTPPPEPDMSDEDSDDQMDVDVEMGEGSGSDQQPEEQEDDAPMSYIAEEEATRKRKRDELELDALTYRQFGSKIGSPSPPPSPSSLEPAESGADFSARQAQLQALIAEAVQEAAIRARQPHLQALVAEVVQEAAARRAQEAQAADSGEETLDNDREEAEEEGERNEDEEIEDEGEMGDDEETDEVEESEEDDELTPPRSPLMGKQYMTGRWTIRTRRY